MMIVNDINLKCHMNYDLFAKLQNWYFMATACAGTPQHAAIRLIVQALFCQFIKAQLPADFFTKQPDYTAHPIFDLPLFHTTHQIPDIYLFSEHGLYTILAQYEYSLDDHTVITPDFMGFVHEELLENVKVGSQNARKETGSFYTPPEITDYMITATLDEFQRRGGDLRDCKILDPAVGCGEFLIRLFHEICRRVDADSPLKRQILNNLYGTDIQPLAVEITQARLFLAVLWGDATALPDASTNISVADVLLGYTPPVQFDIIIGNPPYIQLQNNGGLLAKKYTPCRYKTLTGRGDIYVLFYERGVQLLKPHGLLCYISSNKWLRATYGDKLRQFIKTHTNPLKLLNFDTTRLFKSASINTNILLLANEPNTYAPFAYTVTHVDDLKRELPAHLPLQTAARWILLSPVEQSIKTKIETHGIPLNRWQIKIQQGLKTSYDAAFVIDGAKRQELIEADPKSAEIIKPFIRGKDIAHDGYTFNDTWLIATLPCHHIDIEKYPAVKAHLLQYYDRLLNREQRGQEWYEIQNTTGFWRDFAKTKIIFPLITQKANFYVDETGMYMNSSCNMIITLYPYYLCALLMSPLYEYAIKHVFTICSLGHGYFNNILSVLNLPVHMPTAEQRVHIETLFKNKDASLNHEIYKMYELTADEIAVIEKNE